MNVCSYRTSFIRFKFDVFYMGGDRSLDDFPLFLSFKHLKNTIYRKTHIEMCLNFADFMSRCQPIPPERPVLVRNAAIMPVLFKYDDKGMLSYSAGMIFERIRCSCVKLGVDFESGLNWMSTQRAWVRSGLYSLKRSEKTM
jgi:hypothetical protein